MDSDKNEIDQKGTAAAEEKAVITAVPQNNLIMGEEQA